MSKGSIAFGYRSRTVRQRSFSGRVSVRLLAVSAVLALVAVVLAVVALTHGDYPLTIEQVFATLLGGDRGFEWTIVAEWRLQKVPHVDLAPLVLRSGRAADLIVAGQTDPHWDLSPLLDFPERLALESGRPVLIVPYAGRFPRVGRRVVIAWKAGRESARAAFDAWSEGLKVTEPA